MGDVEDPDIFAAQPIWDWQQTEIGKWCMENAGDVHWVTDLDTQFYGYVVKIFGDLEGKHLTYFRLKNS